MSCRCDCGYKCGGPGYCELWNKEGTEGMLECVNTHFVRDCDHKWDGPFIHFEGGGSATCSTCSLTACDHDCMVGP